jgi:hypothetical protein
MKQIYTLFAILFIAALFTSSYILLQPTTFLEKKDSQKEYPGPFEIQVVGLDGCATKTNLALDLIRGKANDHYNTIVNYVGTIECTDSQSGMHVWEKPPRYQVGKATVDAGTIWYAGTISHDACHSKQYHDYLFENPSKDVPSEIYTGKNAEAQCLAFQYNTLKKIGATQDTLNYLTDIINSEYWNVDYGERWW